MSELDIIKRWPQYENGEFVNFGDELPDFARTIYKTVKTVQFNDNGVVTISNNGGSANINVFLRPGERLKRTAKALAADGRPLREGETVWDTKGNGPYNIQKIENDGVIRIDGSSLDYFGSDFVRERPDSWKRLEEDARKHRYAYWECETFRCSACPTVVDGKNPQERYGVDDCQDAMQCDLVRRAKALAERDA